MKRNRTSLPIYLLPILMVIAFSPLFGQIESSANFIKGGKNDAVKIISAYLLPVEKAMCLNGANNNMLLFKASDTHNAQFGFSLNLTSSWVNSADYTYDVNKLNLEKFEAQDVNNSNAQTLAGNISTITLQTKQKYRVATTSYPYYTEKPILTLESPKGENTTNVLFPVLNIFFEKQGNMIDINILPPLTIESNTLKIFSIGINLQHNLETSLKFISDFWFDLYLSGGYNYIKVANILNIKPDESSLTFSSTSDNGPYDSQELQIHSISIPFKLTIVKQFRHFSFSAGGGYNFTTSKVMMVGKYPIYSTDPSNSFSIVVDDIEDPFQYSRNFNKISFDAGINYRLNHYSFGLKYSNSYYSNFTLTMGYLF